MRSYNRIKARDRKGANLNRELRVASYYVRGDNKSLTREDYISLEDCERAKREFKIK